MAFTLATSNGKRTSKSAGTSTREESEFDGLWINVGVMTENEDGSEDFVRMPRGIAVSDLKDHAIYANSNEDWAAQAAVANTVMKAIREEGLTLEEGESKLVNLSVQLYRRQEAVEQISPEIDAAGIKASLFS